MSGNPGTTGGGDSNADDDADVGPGPGNDDNDPSSPDDTGDTEAPPGDTSASTAGQTETGDPPPVDCESDPDCDDGNPCTTGQCVGSVCSYTPMNCDDLLDCTMDTCEGGACVHTPDDSMCADADLCNGEELCSISSGCIAGTPVSCSDGDSCTEDECDPMTGSCDYPAIETCAGADSCCPIGCSVQADNDCVCTNLAGSATATSNGGGQEIYNYGPSNWIDGVDQGGCEASACSECYGWISNSPGTNGSWMQLTWAASQTIGSVYVYTNGCDSDNRHLYSGSLQYWSGAAWVTESSWNGANGDLSFDFDPPVDTTMIRLMDVQPPPGGLNSLTFEWYVYTPLGCTP